MHALDPRQAPEPLLECARATIRRFRFNPGPPEDRVYRVELRLGPKSQLLGWERRAGHLDVDDPSPQRDESLRVGPAKAGPSELERVLKEGAVKGNAAELLGQSRR